MKKVFGISIVLIIIDQLLRYYAQYNLYDKIIGNKHFGLTYRINYGIYLHPNANKYFMLLLAIAFLIILFFSYFAYEYYCTHIRRSTLIDIAYASLIASILGNVYIDRIIFGYVRDYIITPIAIANLADILIEISIFLLILEMIINKEARKLLRKDFNLKNIKIFLIYIINKLDKKDNSDKLK
ncbi:signal peptidase II [Clostridium sp. KNHs205]|jgi:lipoprotein signal peptidase|uniref:signal peptidase II n=1 Tax=Clostridium sp. KNHs205 TaxID=1449050 RepID=UPI00051C1F01|nr:signal peptidase II [Clostridium sp. KNHs205]